MRFEGEQKMEICFPEQQDAFWRKLAEHTNEMIVSEEGRSLFPNLDYHIDGLHPNKMYALYIEFHQVDDFGYEFKKEKWVINGSSTVSSAVVNDNAKKVCHTDDVRMGKHWMESTINFDHVKITTDPGHKSPSNVFLRSMHKYVPVLSIYESPYAFLVSNLALKPIAVVRIDYTEFIAVESYQNETVKKMKTSSNSHFNKCRDWLNDNHKRSQIFSPPEDSPKPKRQKLEEVPIMEEFPTIIPLPIMLPLPHFLHNPFLPADHSHYPQLDVNMVNKVLGELVNSDFPLDLLNLANSNANMFTGVVPNSNMYPIISSPLTYFEENDDF